LLFKFLSFVFQLKGERGERTTILAQ